jgi:hypothetical protein
MYSCTQPVALFISTDLEVCHLVLQLTMESEITEESLAVTVNLKKQLTLTETEKSKSISCY